MNYFLTEEQQFIKEIAMFKIIRKRKAQNTAEYAILIALVIGAAVAMQTYGQRALQARMRDASQKLVGDTIGLGGSKQYEPYYSNSSADVDSHRGYSDALGKRGEVTRTEINETTSRKADAYDRAEFNLNTTANQTTWR